MAPSVRGGPPLLWSTPPRRCSPASAMACPTAASPETRCQREATADRPRSRRFVPTEELGQHVLFFGRRPSRVQRAPGPRDCRCDEERLGVGSPDRLDVDLELSIGGTEVDCFSRPEANHSELRLSERVHESLAEFLVAHGGEGSFSSDGTARARSVAGEALGRGGWSALEPRKHRIALKVRNSDASVHWVVAAHWLSDGFQAHGSAADRLHRRSMPAIEAGIKVDAPIGSSAHRLSTTARPGAAIVRGFEVRSRYSAA